MFIFNTVFVASLTFSIVETDTNQGFAYFDTRTRLWEFAIGTLLAMAHPQVEGTREGSSSYGLGSAFLVWSPAGASCPWNEHSPATWRSGP